MDSLESKPFSFFEDLNVTCMTCTWFEAGIEAYHFTVLDLLSNRFEELTPPIFQHLCPWDHVRLRVKTRCNCVMLNTVMLQDADSHLQQTVPKATWSHICLATC